jgi:hypothetical protein
MEIDITIITKGEIVILFTKIIRTKEIIGLTIFTGIISGFKEGSIALRNFWLKIVTLAPVSTNIEMGLLQFIVSI